MAIAQALPDAVDNSFGDRQQILNFSRALTPEDVQLFYQTALIGRRDLHLSPDPRAGFEMTLCVCSRSSRRGLVDLPQRDPAFCRWAGASTASTDCSRGGGARSRGAHDRCVSAEASLPVSRRAAAPPASRANLSRAAENPFCGGARAPVQSHAGPERVDDSAVALDIPAPVAPEPSGVEDAEQSPAGSCQSEAG